MLIKQVEEYAPLILAVKANVGACAMPYALL